MDVRRCTASGQHAITGRIHFRSVPKHEIPILRLHVLDGCRRVGATRLALVRLHVTPRSP